MSTRGRRYLPALLLVSVAFGCDAGATDNPSAGTGAGGAMGGAGGLGGMTGGVGGAAGIAGISGGVGGMTGGAGGVGGMTGGDGGMTGGAGGMTGGTGGAPPLYDGPMLLSQAGLYANMATGELAPDVQEYEPLGQLWSDGATKKRWLKLPADSVIDTQDMDNWVFPVDTRAFKEFSRDGVRIETRMVWKRAPGDWQMIAFLWNDEQTEAVAAIDGQPDAKGTMHDVPDATKCPRCHAPRSEQLLGPTALMLSHDKPGLTLSTLIADGRLSHPPTTMPALPGDDDTQAALAYLHANCGGCHNPDAVDADRVISVYFWQKTAALATLEDTVTYKSLVTDKATPVWIDAVISRMSARGAGSEQMPPLATEIVDEEGLATVATLMDQLRSDMPALPPKATGGTCPDIQPIFDMFATLGPLDTCGRSFCHGGDASGLFYETAPALLQELVAVQPTGEGCENSALSRVEPGSPERSLLWLKLNPGPPCGSIMPPLHSLTEDQLQMVYDWISACTPTP